jgi:hypothetical protein
MSEGRNVSMPEGGGGGYYGDSHWGDGGGTGIGLGTILVILLVVYMMGGLR